MKMMHSATINTKFTKFKFDLEL